MKQHRLAEETIILSTTATESAELNENWFGTFQVALNVAGSNPVKLEYKRKGSNTWIVARYNSSEITLSTAGDTLDIVLTEHRIYRFKTATQGAEVVIDNH